MLWEILIPKTSPRRQRTWSARIREMTNGLTVLPSCHGEWLSPEGRLYAENVVPVRIACRATQIHRIAAMSAVFFAQQAMMYYLVSPKVFIRHFAGKGT